MLESLLQPKRIAVVGVTGEADDVARRLVRNLVEGGFGGEVVAVGDVGSDCPVCTVVDSLDDAPKPLDLALIAVGAEEAAQAARDASRAGARAVVVLSPGFREMGESGAVLEQELVRLCGERDVRLLGPNCLGLMDAHLRMNASLAAPLPPAGGVSIISQSGALATALLHRVTERRLGLSKLISIGNAADVSEADLLRALAADDTTRVIVGYLESIVDGDALMKAAKQAASRKPVVMLKAGVTGAGRLAAACHSGSLADADIAYGAAFRRAGVVEARSLDHLIDAAEALCRVPLPRGQGVAVISNAGGPGVVTADAVEQADLRVVPLGAALSAASPITVLGDVAPERYARAVQAALEQVDVDAVLLTLAPGSLSAPAKIMRALDDLGMPSKPVLLVWMGGEPPLPDGAEDAPTLPCYPSPDRALGALAALRTYHAWRDRPPRVVTRFAVNRRRVERVIARQRRAGMLEVDELHAKEILAAYDFAVPEGELAGSREEAVEIAQRIGPPVALKIASPDIRHKTQSGGIRLDLGHPDAVRDAYDLMMLRIARRRPDARLDGVFVEKMVNRGREVILGMRRDPQFGPMLMFGVGGIFVETMQDVAFHLAPITAAEAKQMLATTRSYELLRGGPGGEHGVDLGAIADGLQRVSQLVTDFPEIRELDINPFIVGAVGSEAYVADARLVLAPEPDDV